MKTHIHTHRDQPTNVIAFSQYAQYCCNTTGSSINAIAKYFLARNNNGTPPFKLSFIDRWSMNSGLVNTFKQLVEAEIDKFPPKKRNNVLLLFTAHSLPLKVNMYIYLYVFVFDLFARLTLGSIHILRERERERERTK